MIVVTAPTGLIGSQVLAGVLEHGEEVRVVVRDAARLPAEVRNRVEVVEGSHGDRSVVDRALVGADVVFWLVPPDPQASSPTSAYVDFSRPGAEAVRRQRVPRLVTVSALGRGTPVAGDAGFVTASLAMDDLMAGTGVHLRAMTMPSFMDNLLRQVQPIREDGVFFGLLAGGRRVPSCATRDIAARATGLLVDHTWAGQQSTAVLGPEDLSFDDMAATMTEVLGRPVRYQQLTAAQQKATLVQRGMSDAMAQGMVDMGVAKDNGLDDGEPRTPHNTTPTTFRQWCAEVLVPALG